MESCRRCDVSDAWGRSPYCAPCLRELQRRAARMLGGGEATTQDVVEELGVSPGAVQQWKRRGVVPHTPALCQVCSKRSGSRAHFCPPCALEKREAVRGMLKRGAPWVVISSTLKIPITTLWSWSARGIV